MNENVYPVKFKDLVRELAKIFEMDYKKDMIGFYVSTSVCYYGKYTLDEMINLMNDEDFNFRFGHDYLYVTMYGKKDAKFVFFYNFQFKFNCDEIQSDGKRLKDYLNVKKGGIYFNNLNYSSIEVDDNVDNLVLYFDDEMLAKNDKIDFFPGEKLRLAIDNCRTRNGKKLIKR